MPQWRFDLKDPANLLDTPIRHKASAFTDSWSLVFFEKLIVTYIAMIFLSLL
jgi:hypothetical protein